MMNIAVFSDIHGNYVAFEKCLEYALKREIKFGVKNVKLAGPGAYARTIPNELLVKIMNDPKQRADFLDFCYQYDSNPYVCGMGKDNLLAKGELD